MANGESRLVAEEEEHIKALKAERELFWLDHHSSEKSDCVLFSQYYQGYLFKGINSYILTSLKKYSDNGLLLCQVSK